MISNIMIITIGSTVWTASLYNNPSVTALKNLMSKGPLTINMNDYANMEKVGPLGTSIPRNDVMLDTQPGDIIVYLGTSIVIYYGTNHYSLTPIGKINGVAQDELKRVLGEGSVTVSFSLPDTDHETGEETKDGHASSEKEDNGERTAPAQSPGGNSKKSSKTAVIAGTVSAAAVVVIAVAVVGVLYFKKSVCFKEKEDASEQEE